LFGSYTIACIRSEIFSFKAIKHGLFIRIFRVLHTVQSSVFKVLFVLSASTATRISYHFWLFLSTIFFIFFKTFSSVHDVFWKKFLPPFPAASYIIPKQTTFVNTILQLF